MLVRNIIYLIVIIVVLGGLWIAKPGQAITPHGIFLPATKQTFSPVAPGTRIQISSTTPAGAQVIGNINVSTRLTTASTEMEQEIIDYAMQLAAKNGANGIIIQYFFTAKDEIPQYFLSAKAIKTS